MTDKGEEKRLAVCGWGQALISCIDRRCGERDLREWEIVCIIVVSMPLWFQVILRKLIYPLTFSYQVSRYWIGGYLNISHDTLLHFPIYTAHILSQDVLGDLKHIIFLRLFFPSFIALPVFIFYREFLLSSFLYSTLYPFHVFSAPNLLKASSPIDLTDHVPVSFFKGLSLFRMDLLNPWWNITLCTCAKGPFHIMYLTYKSTSPYCRVSFSVRVPFISHTSNINPLPRLPPSIIMNLKLSALIFFTSTLISLSNSLAQEAKDDQLDKMRAKLHELAQPAPTLDVGPANFSDLNPPKKRKEPELPRVDFYVCAEPLLNGRCEKLSSKRGFCCTCCVSPVLTRTHNTSPSHGIIIPFFFGMRVQYLTIIMILLDKLKNGWDDEISSLCPQAHTKCTVYE